MIAYITKYALTKGILEVGGDVSLNFPDMFNVEREGRPLYQSFHGHGRDWHLNRVSAVVRARDMRDAKIKSLRAQIERLEKMEF